MSGRRIAAIALTGALVVGGGGAAIAAVTKDDGKQAEQAVLADAAKRLDVTPEKLREALAAAQDAQIDQAVKDGKLTQKQADAIKARRKQSGRVLGGGPLGGPHGGPGGRGHHGGPGGPGPHRALFGDLAKALGLTPAKLLEQLRTGKSVTDVAKARGKSLSDVESAVKSAAKTRLDKAVADGDVTRRQADAMLEHLDEELTALEQGGALKFRGHRHGPPPGAPPGAPQPGSFTPTPGEDAPVPAPEGAAFS